MVPQGIAGATLGSERSIPALCLTAGRVRQAGSKLFPIFSPGSRLDRPEWTAAKNSDGGSAGGLRSKNVGGDDAYGRVRSKPDPYAQSKLMKCFR